MNRKLKISMILSILLFASLFSLVFANVVYLQVPQTEEDRVKSEDLYTVVTDELKFCTNKKNYRNI